MDIDQIIAQEMAGASPAASVNPPAASAVQPQAPAPVPAPAAAAPPAPTGPTHVDAIIADELALAHQQRQQAAIQQQQPVAAVHAPAGPQAPARGVLGTTYDAAEDFFGRGIPVGVATGVSNLGAAVTGATEYAARKMGFDGQADAAQRNMASFGKFNQMVSDALPPTAAAQANPYGVAGIAGKAGEALPNIALTIANPTAGMLAAGAQQYGQSYGSFLELAHEKFPNATREELAGMTQNLAAADAGFTALVNRYGPLNRIMRGNPLAQTAIKRIALSVAGNVGESALQQAGSELARWGIDPNPDLMASLKRVGDTAYFAITPGVGVGVGHAMQGVKAPTASGNPHVEPAAHAAAPAADGSIPGVGTGEFHAPAPAEFDQATFDRMMSAKLPAEAPVAAPAGEPAAQPIDVEKLGATFEPPTAHDEATLTRIANPPPVQPEPRADFSETVPQRRRSDLPIPLGSEADPSEVNRIRARMFAEEKTNPEYGRRHADEPRTELATVPDDLAGKSNGEIRQWAEDNGYFLPEKNSPQAQGMGKGKMIEALRKQQQQNVIDTNPRLPDEGKTWDAGRLRRWASDNGYDVPIDLPEDARPRDAVRAAIEAQYNKPRGARPAAKPAAPAPVETPAAPAPAPAKATVAAPRPTSKTAEESESSIVAVQQQFVDLRSKLERGELAGAEKTGAEKLTDHLAAEVQRMIGQHEAAYGEDASEQVFEKVAAIKPTAAPAPKPAAAPAAKTKQTTDQAEMERILRERGIAIPEAKHAAGPALHLTPDQAGDVVAGLDTKDDGHREWLVKVLKEYSGDKGIDAKKVAAAMNAGKLDLPPKLGSKPAKPQRPYGTPNYATEAPAEPLKPIRTSGQLDLQGNEVGALTGKQRGMFDEAAPAREESKPTGDARDAKIARQYDQKATPTFDVLNDPALAAARAEVSDFEPVEGKTDLQKELAALHERRGKRVVFYRSEQPGRAFTHGEHPDTLFVHEKNNSPEMVREAVAHELIDSLDSPTREALRGTVDAEALDAAKKEYSARYKGKPISDERLNDEALALVLGRTFQDGHRWRALAAVEPTALNRVNDSIGKLRDRLSGSGSRVDAVLERLGGAVDKAQGGAAAGTVSTMKTDDLHVDPERFQFKANADAAGVTKPIEGKYDPEKAGVIAVWDDPSDGKTYVVNGHHRFDRAKSDGAESVNVLHIAANDAAEARMKGALINIGEGRGTATDAAKVFRDGGIASVEDLRKLNVNINEGKATDGLALARLGDKLFKQVTSGDMSEGRGVAIGEAAHTPEAQDALMSLLAKHPALTDAQVRKLGQLAASSPTVEENRGAGGLFGDDWVNKNLLVEKAVLADKIERRLSRDQKAFGNAGRNAARLKRVGEVNAAEAKEISRAAAEAKFVFDKLSTAKGPVSDALNEGAQRINAGEKPEAVADAMYDRVLDAVKADPKIRFLPDEAGGFTDDQLADAIRSMGDKVPRPDLSQRANTDEGRKGYAAVDATRETPTRPDADVQAEADRLRGLGPEFENAMIERSKLGGQFSDAETRAIADHVDAELPKAIEAGDTSRIARLGNLILADRQAGTEQGRAFRQRRDPRKPAERAKRFVMEAIAVDDTAMLFDNPPRVTDKPGSNGNGEASGNGKPRPVLDEAKAGANGQRLIDHLKRNGYNPADMDRMTPGRMAKMVREVQNFRGSKWDAAYEYWINSILSAVGTHAGNTASNAAHLAYAQGLVRPVEALINDVFLRDPNGATLGELPGMYKSILPAIQKGAAHFWRSFKAESPTFDAEIEGDPALFGDKVFDRRRPGITGKKGEAIRTPSRALVAADQFFKSIAGRIEVAARAYRNGKVQGLKGEAMNDFIAGEVANPGSKSWEQAFDFAKEMTFQQEAGPILNRVMKARDAVHGEWVIPFVRTPANIFKTAARLSPFGALRMGYKLGNNVVQMVGGGTPQYGRAEFARNTAEQALAWGALMALSAGVGGDDPWITGSGQPFGKLKFGAQRQTSLRTAPPQSIKLGGSWYSYARVEPFATALAASVNAVEELKNTLHGRSAPDALEAFFGKNMGMVKDKTFLRGIGDIMDAMEEPKMAQAYLRNFTASWVPNIVRSTSNAGDTMARENRELGEGDNATTGTQKFVRKAAPFADVPAPKVNLWGEAIDKNPGFSPATDFLARVVGIQSAKASASRIDHFILAWNTRNPDQRFDPMTPDPTVKVRGKERVMDEREYNLFTRATGRIAARRIEGQVNVDPDKPTQRAVDYIRKTLGEVREAGRRAMARALDAKDRGDTAAYQRELDHLRKLVDDNAPKE
jgi:hypothetical protein